MNFLKDLKTPENALLSNSVLDEIMLDKNWEPQYTALIETQEIAHDVNGVPYTKALIKTPKGLFSEVLKIQFNYKIEEITGGRDYWFLDYNNPNQVDVDITIFGAKLPYIFPYFALIQEIENKELKEKATQELSNNIVKFLKRSNLRILYNGANYFIERLGPEFDDIVKGLPYPILYPHEHEKIKDRIHPFKLFFENLIEIATKEKQKDNEEKELKYIEFRKNQENLVNSEKMKNYKETGFKETNRDREIREEEEKNFKETGIKETDYGRKIREEEEREKSKNKRKRKKIKQDKISHAKNMAEEHCKDYKNGLISYGELKSKLEIMQLKGRLNQDYIDNLLEAFNED